MALTERQRGEMFASHATSSLALARGALLAAPPSHCADGRGALPPSCLLGAGMRPSRRTWNRLEVILPKLPPTLPPRQAWIAPQWPPPRVRLRRALPPRTLAVTARSAAPPSRRWTERKLLERKWTSVVRLQRRVRADPLRTPRRLACPLCAPPAFRLCSSKRRTSSSSSVSSAGRALLRKCGSAWLMPATTSARTGSPHMS